MTNIIMPEEKTRTVKKIHPFGSSLLVETLNSDEMMGTKLFVSKDAKIEGAPHAYIVELGPNLKDCGVSVGDRVVVQGNHIPVPNTDGTGRARGIIELHNIKAIVDEG